MDFAENVFNKICTSFADAMDKNLIDVLTNADNIDWWKNKRSNAVKMLRNASIKLKTEPNIDFGGPGPGSTHLGYIRTISNAESEILLCDKNIKRLILKEIKNV